MKKTTLLLCTLFLAACGSDPLLPGEDIYNQHVEAGEALMKTNATDSAACSKISNHFKEGIEGFQLMMPHLKGMQLRKKDARLGTLREYTERNC